MSRDRPVSKHTPHTTRLRGPAIAPTEQADNIPRCEQCSRRVPFDAARVSLPDPARGWLCLPCWIARTDREESMAARAEELKR